MEKKTAGLIGAIAGLAALGSVQAAAQPAVTAPDALHAASYSDLLSPIPNAVQQLHVDDARLSVQRLSTDRQQGEDSTGLPLQRVQYHDHHHHHHHHRPPPHHHHHHHSAYFAAPAPAGGAGSVNQT